jgi:hypothetical protein
MSGNSGVCGNTPQGGASEDNTADDALMVDQARKGRLDATPHFYYNLCLE